MVTALGLGVFWFSGSAQQDGSLHARVSVEHVARRPPCPASQFQDKTMPPTTPEIAPESPKP